MNYKLEKFWNASGNLSCDEICMNYKLEKFWNFKVADEKTGETEMNYKLEKFWNRKGTSQKIGDLLDEL